LVTAQICRWLRHRPGWHVCAVSIYDSVYRGLMRVVDPLTLRTGRTYCHRRGRGRSRDGALK